MRILLLDPSPPEVEQLIERRRRLGLDLYDEVWEGVYHVAPAPHPYHGYLDDQLTRILGRYAEAAGLVGTGPFNLGGPDDFRVPDHGYHRILPGSACTATAAVAVEVVSPGDETYDKLPFYAAHEVDEVLIAEPAQRQVRILTRAGDHYDETGRSAVLGVSAKDLTAAIRWP